MNSNQAAHWINAGWNDCKQKCLAGPEYGRYSHEQRELAEAGFHLAFLGFSPIEIIPNIRPKELASLEHIQAIIAELPDNYSESKDWKQGNIVSRIQWLKAMLESSRAEIERLENQ